MLMRYQLQRLPAASTLLLWLVSLTTAQADPPEVRFDVPQRVSAHQVLDATEPTAQRLIEVSVPISARVTRGDVRGVQQITIEIDGGRDALVVHDFAPSTALGSEHAGDIQVTTTSEKSKSFEASLGGQSPIPIGDVVAQVTPSFSAGVKNRTAETQSTARLSPKRPTVVSGTINEGRGVFFQLRPSSQTTLEGQHQLSVVFRVPDNWSAGQLEVRCWARGERQILWFDQPQVWGSTHRTVGVSLPSLAGTTPLVRSNSDRETIHRQSAAKLHRVAKQPTEGITDGWKPVKE